MKIEFDTNSLSALDTKILALLASENNSWPPTPAAVKPPKPAPAPAPKKSTKPDMDPDADFQPDPEQQPAAAEEQPAATMADAVAAATKLVSTGGAAKVKAALAEVNAKRVSEIAPESIGAFVAALQA